MGSCNCYRPDKDCKKCKEESYIRVYPDWVDKLCDTPCKFKLQYPKGLDKKQKRVIRKAFNEIQPDLKKMFEEAYKRIVILGETEIFLEDLYNSEKSTAKSELNFP
jgi:hypothetical protein